MELIGTTITAEKSQFIIAGLKIINWMCDYNNQHPDKVKIIKVLNWPVPVNIPKLYRFIRLTVYFQVLIDKF